MENTDPLFFFSRILVEQECVLRNVENILVDSQNEARASAAVALKQDVLQWLSIYDFEAMYARAASIRSPGTCGWLLEVEEFRALDRSEMPCLWLHGMAGSGKTILASRVIDHFLSAPKHDRGSIAYFYCDAGDSDSLRTEVVLGSLLFQLCAQLDAMPPPILEAFKESGRIPGQRRRPTVDQLRAMALLALVESKRPIFVIDGIDEVNDRRVLCEALTSLLSDPSNDLRAFLASRSEPDIRAALSKLVAISSQSAPAGDDIDSYIDDQMVKNPRFQTMTARMRHLVRQALRKNAQGMWACPSRPLRKYLSVFIYLMSGRFRWVQCQIDEMSKIRTDKAIKAALANLPVGLEETYA